MKWQCNLCTSYSEEGSLVCDTCGEGYVPRVRKFSFEHAYVEIGKKSRVSWEVDYCDKLDLVGYGIFDSSGFLELTLEKGETLTLIATNPQTTKKVLSTATIKRELPEIRSFESDSEIVTLSKAYLSWKVLNFLKLYLEPGHIDVSSRFGIEVDPVDTTTYKLLATGHSGNVEEELTLVLNPPVVISFESNTDIITKSMMSVSWDVTAAEKITLLPGGEVFTKAKGSSSVIADDTIKIELIAENIKGVTRSELTIYRKFPEVSHFIVDSTKVIKGSDVVIHWSVRNAAECYLIIDSKIEVPFVGTHLVSGLEHSMDLEIIAIDDFGIEEREIIEIEVVEIEFFSLDKKTGMLTWSTSGFEKVMIEPFSIKVPAIGEYKVERIMVADYFRLECYIGTVVSSRAEIKVDLPSIDYFVLENAVVCKGDFLKFKWKTTNGERIKVLPIDMVLDKAEGSMEYLWIKEIEYLQLSVTSFFGDLLSRRIYITGVEMLEVDVITDSVIDGIKKVNVSYTKPDTTPVRLRMIEALSMRLGRVKVSLVNYFSLPREIKVSLENTIVRLDTLKVSLGSFVLKNWKYSIYPKVLSLLEFVPKLGKAPISYYKKMLDIIQNKRDDT